MKNTIVVENLHKSFDGNEVIRGVNLEVGKGTILALMGRSGIGKSVLLKLIAGLIKPDHGRILVDGKDIGRMRQRDLIKMRKNLGFLFQGGALFDSMTVYDNIAFPLREKTRISESEVRDRIMDELAQVGLSKAKEKYPSQLSGGMKKRAALARELIMEPSIMLFDEPTTGLDPIIGNAILKLIDMLHKKHQFTGIIVTHEIHKVFAIANSIAMLHDGLITASGTVDEILSSDDPAVKQFISGDTEGPVLYD